MEIQGEIRLINDTVQISDKFKKRDLIIVTKEQYPQTISIQFTQDKADILNNFSIGDNVSISVNLRGKDFM